MGDQPYGMNPEKVASLAAEVKRVNDLGVETALVIGAGNIYRGMAATA